MQRIERYVKILNDEIKKRESICRMIVAHYDNDRFNEMYSLANKHSMSLKFENSRSKYLILKKDEHKIAKRESRVSRKGRLELCSVWIGVDAVMEIDSTFNNAFCLYESVLYNGVSKLYDNKTLDMINIEIQGDKIYSDRLAFRNKKMSKTTVAKLLVIPVSLNVEYDPANHCLNNKSLYVVVYGTVIARSYLKVEVTIDAGNGVCEKKVNDYYDWKGKYDLILLPSLTEWTEFRVKLMVQKNAILSDDYEVSSCSFTLDNRASVACMNPLNIRSYCRNIKYFEEYNTCDLSNKREMLLIDDLSTSSYDLNLMGAFNRRLYINGILMNCYWGSFVNDIYRGNEYALERVSRIEFSEKDITFSILSPDMKSLEIMVSSLDGKIKTRKVYELDNKKIRKLAQPFKNRYYEIVNLFRLMSRDEMIDIYDIDKILAYLSNAYVGYRLTGNYDLNNLNNLNILSTVRCYTWNSFRLYL